MIFFFFCKQKTAYEMRISDWSSDVCSSDLEHVTGDMIERVGLLDIAAGLADHDTQLDFPIGLGAAARDHDVVIGADEARNGLGEEDRFGWGLESGLARMIGIIEADREEFADAVHRQDRKSTRLNSSH